MERSKESFDRYGGWIQRESQAHAEDSRIIINGVKEEEKRGSSFSSVSGKDISCFLPQVRIAIGWASVAQRTLWGLSSGTCRVVTMRLYLLSRIETLPHMPVSSTACATAASGMTEEIMRQQAR